MSCTIPANQPIYEALLDKAYYYPADYIYHIKAYKKAAESILTYDKNIYDEVAKNYGFIVRPANIGVKIEDFIYNFIIANPQPDTSEATAPTIYTAENPRRSRRLLKKPTPKYFTEEDEIYDAIEAVCSKKGYEFSEDLITEFNTWLTTSDTYGSMSKYDIAKQWAIYDSKSLMEQKKQMIITKTIIKYCEKNHITYESVMDEKFAQWKADPANKNLILISEVLWFSDRCTCINCDPTGTKKANPPEFNLERTPAYCVNKWFSTLKKTIVW